MAIFVSDDHPSLYDSGRSGQRLTKIDGLNFFPIFKLQSIKPTIFRSEKHFTSTKNHRRRVDFAAG